MSRSRATARARAPRSAREGTTRARDARTAKDLRIRLGGKRLQ